MRIFVLDVLPKAFRLRRPERRVHVGTRSAGAEESGVKKASNYGGIGQRPTQKPAASHASTFGTKATLQSRFPAWPGLASTTGARRHFAGALASAWCVGGAQRPIPGVFTGHLDGWSFVGRLRFTPLKAELQAGPRHVGNGKKGLSKTAKFPARPRKETKGPRQPGRQTVLRPGTRLPQFSPQLKFRALAAVA